MSYKFRWLVLIFVLFPSFTYAGTVVCSGTVTMLAYHSPNNIDA